MQLLLFRRCLILKKIKMSKTVRFEIKAISKNGKKIRSRKEKSSRPKARVSNLDELIREEEYGR